MIAGICGFSSAFAIPLTTVTVNIAATTTVVMSGSVQATVSGGAFVNSGSYTDAAGNFNVNSSGMAFSGSGTTSLYKLVFNTSTGTSTFGSVVTVNDSANITAGAVNASSELTLGSNALLVNDGSLTNNVEGLKTIASVTTGGCPSYTSNLSLNISGTEMAYQWQSSPDNSTWSNVTGATNATYTATVTTTVYYRCNLTTLNTAYAQSTPGVELIFNYVAPNPGTISGTYTVCATSTASLTASGTGGGTWSSTNTAVGTVSTSGSVYGVAGGTTTISYTVTNSCGTAAATQVVTVNALANAGSITGGSTVCTGLTLALTDATGSGTWSSTNVAAGTVSSSGVVYGVSGGSTTISYTVSNECGAVAATQVFSVTQTPTANAVTNQTVCNGQNTTLINFSGTPGPPPSVGIIYSWSNSNTAIGIVGSGTGNTIASFTATNTGITGISGVFTVVPSYLGCTGAPVNFTISVNPTPTVNGVSNQQVCNTQSTTTITFSGDIGTATYNWTNSNTNIGTAANGSNSVAAFAGTNSGTSIITGLFSVTPTASGCNGTATTFTISVNPTPTVADVSDQEVCNTQNTSAVTFLGSVSGTVYNWSNSNTNIGEAASGVGNIGIFAGTNSGSSVITGTFTVTPTANGCPGTPTTFTISVDPTPSITLGTSPSVIQGTTSANLPYTATTGGANHYSITWSDAATTAGFAAVSSNSLTATPITITVPGAAAVAAYSGTVTVTNAGSCVSAAAPFTLTVLAPLTFTGANPATLTVCENSGETDITSLLTVSDVSISNTDTWSVVTNPPNGTLNGFDAAEPSGSTSITPSGLTYMPNSSYSGSDAFVIQVSNGSATTTMTVNVTVTPIPGSINGVTTVCQSSTTQLTDGAAGGTWSSGNTGVATVDPSSGLVSGVSGGSTSISYTTGCGSDVGTTVSVTAIPASINGTTTVCQGSTTSLSDASASGTWSSGNTSVATVDPSSGTVSGVSGGSVTIQYSTGCGTAATTTVSVTAIPTGINGNTMVCQSSTTSLSDASASGTWSSGNTSVATVDPSSGIVTGVSGGNATIQYSTGCGTAATTTVSVTAIPTGINGTTTVCQGSTTSLSDASASGTWSSGNTGVATVDPASGVVSGITGGSVTIQYSTGCGTAAATTVSVTAIPTSINGTTTVCQSSTTQLTDASASGTWSSANTGVATVDPASGVVSGITGGSVTIQYNTGCGTAASTTVSVTAIPTSINGTTTVCQGSTTSLSDASASGTWSSSNTSVATVDPSSGVVSGVSGGSATIQYSTGCGSASTTTVSVTAIPAIITGTNSICVNATTQLNDAAASGTWSSSNTSIANVDGTGFVTAGPTSGTTTISYNTGCGTAATFALTTNATAAGTITGPSSVILGSSVNLTDAVTGGVWSASNGDATVSGGLVTAVTAGTLTISYAVTGTCGTAYATKVMTVSNSLCYGSVTTLTAGTPGGTWSMESNSATINDTTGVLTARTGYPGTATVTYTLGGVHTYIVVTVYPNPTPIQCSALLCTGVSYTLSDITDGGQWSASGDALVSGVGTAGTITAGAVAGTAVLTYTLPTGCITTLEKIVYSNPPPITGTFIMCTGSATTLTDASPLLSWKSSDTSVAKFVGSSLVGQNAGTSTITFMSGSAGYCIATQVVTVDAPPAAITGNTGAVCPGLTLSLTDGTGTWTSSNTTVATVAGDGTVTGLTGGTSVITYLVGGTAGCTAKTTVSVNTASAITGTAATCPGGTTALHDALSGGTWSSGAPGTATVNTAGIVTGVADGSANITYTTTAGCNIIQPLTVTGVSAQISGMLALCQGGVTTLSDATTGGVWSMSSTLATINGSTGVMTASASLTGTATVTYTSGSCVAIGAVSVNPNPMPIQGLTAECAGLSVSVSDVTAGGTWTATGGATISGSAGTATITGGGAAGTASITYTLPTGCIAKTTNTIYAPPQPIQGNFNLCVGLVTLLSDASPAASWSSSATSIAVCSGADITGESAGTATITFKTTATGSCITTQVVTVSAMPVVTAINGPATISHAGSPVMISDATTGGVWTSSNTSVITLAGSTGSPVGVTALTSTGSSVITYAVTISGCTTKVTKTFSAAASSHPDGGSTTTILAGAAVMIADDMTSGAWSSSDDGIATVDANGLVTGIAPGSVIIMHETTGDDGTVAASRTTVVVTAIPVSVNLVPNPNKGTFVVKGTMGSIADEAVTLEVTDVLGQVIYKTKVMAAGGKLNETISLGNALINGMYILNVVSGTGHTTVHFVIEQ